MRPTKVVGSTFQSPEQVGIRHVIGIDNVSVRQYHLENGIFVSRLLRRFFFFRVFGIPQS